MTTCPMCGEDFANQCAHIVGYADISSRLGGHEVFESNMKRLEVALIKCVQNGFEHSPFPELADPYDVLREQLMEGKPESDSIYRIWELLTESLCEFMSGLHPGMVATSANSAITVEVPKGANVIRGTTWGRGKNGEFVGFRMKRILWSLKPHTLREIFDYHVGLWIPVLERPAVRPGNLGKYRPINLGTEDEYDSRLLEDGGNVPWDPSSDSVLRTVRIALRGAIDGVGPLASLSTQFFHVMGSRAGISMDASIAILAEQCPDLLREALPTLQKVASEAERLIPTIHEMRMPGMAKAFTHGKYTSHISFAKMVESHVSRDSNRCSRQGRT